VTLSETADEKREAEMLRWKATARKWVLGLGLMSVLIGACGSGSDLGTCIIMTSGDDVVIENISFEECQERGLDVPGARGLEWRPNS
jgi:hypothetical protein